MAAQDSLPPLSPLDRLRDHYGMLASDELAEMLGPAPGKSYVVEGLLPCGSVNILVGDSGVGKTALCYQLALAVASGKPFLGFPVKKGGGLLVDYENGMEDYCWILEQQRRHLGLPELPSDLIVWPGQADLPVEEATQRLGPHLLILDSLRSYHPPMERDNATAAQKLRVLRGLAKECGTAVLLIHHVHKRGLAPGHDNAQEDPAPLDWLLAAAGSRALINQTDVRLGFAERHAGEHLLVLRGQARTRGPIGPIFLRRCWDDDGEPLGYERVSLPALINNPEQEAVYGKLSETFRFKEAKLAYGKHNELTDRFLRKLVDLGLVEKMGRGEYRKCSQPDAGHMGV